VTLKTFSNALLLAALTGPALLGASALAQTPAPQPAPAAAATTPPPVPANTPVAEEEVIVTGSSIRRKPTQSAVPLEVFTTEDLKKNSITTPEQFIATLTANGTGLDNLASNADVVSGSARGNNGASSANLRGQGAGATLILLNGRRVAAHGLTGQAVDVNQIPLAAVQRIEVLKDGASAIYGTDAIGGVINFITRKDFQGITASAFADITQAGGGDIYRGSITAGYGDLETQNFNIMASLAYSKSNQLKGSDRDFVNTFQPNRGLSVDTRGTPFATIFPIGANAVWAPTGSLLGTAAGNAPWIPGDPVNRAGGGVNVLDLPGNLGCNAFDGMQAYDEVLWAIPSARFACAWDTGRAAVLQQPLETWTLYARGVVELGQHEIALEVTGSKATASKRFSNNQLTTSNAVNGNNWYYPRNAATAATYDRLFNQLVAFFNTDPRNVVGGVSVLQARYGLPIGFRWRCEACGPRELTTETNTGRVFLSAEGPLAWGWDYRAGLSYAYSEPETTIGTGYHYRNTFTNANGVATPGLVEIINAGLLNPFLLPGESQSQAGMDALRAASALGRVLYGGKYETTQFDASFSGPLWELPAGTMMGAVGFDIRQEKYTFRGTSLPAGTIIFNAPSDDPTDRLNGATRDVRAIYAELLIPLFKGFELTLAGRVDNYSGFGTTTNPKVTFRYQPWQEIAFRGSYSTGFRVPSFNQLFNPTALQPYPGRDLADPARCPTQIVASSGPCVAVQFDQLTGGKDDLGPEDAEMYGLGVIFTPEDWWSLSVDWWRVERSGTIRSLNVQQMFANYAIFTDRFIRDAGGNIIVVDTRSANAGGSITEGVDIAFRMNFEAWGGEISAGLDGSALLKKNSRFLPNTPLGPSEVGVFGFGTDLGLRWKHNLFVTYERGPYSVSLTQLFRAGYRNQQLPGVANGSINPPDDVFTTEDYITYNLSVSYDVLDAATVTFGVKNLLDTDPPFAVAYESASGAGSSWEPRVADPRGRAFTLLLEYRY
jgi:iron complex outermembrane recepter protein